MSLLKALGVEKIIDERVSKLEGEALESVTTARRLVQNIAENKKNLFLTASALKLTQGKVEKNEKIIGRIGDAVEFNQKRLDKLEELGKLQTDVLIKTNPQSGLKL